MKLQDVTGMSDADPIHRYLGMVDKFLGDHDWSDTYRKLLQGELIEAMWLCLGHPVQYPIVEDYCLDNFEEYLKQKGEPVIAEIVYKLRRRKGEEGIDNHGVRVVVMWLVANMDDLKARYLEERNHHRKITADWGPSMVM